MSPKQTTELEPAPAPRRLSLSHVVELLLQRGGGERSSVTLTRNAKGGTQIEVVVRTADAGDVLTVDDAADKARRLYDGLCRRYPLESGSPAPVGGGADA